MSLLENTVSILTSTKDNNLNLIIQKVNAQERLNASDALYLFQYAEIGFLGYLANAVKENKYGKQVFYNKKFSFRTNKCLCV